MSTRWTKTSPSNENGTQQLKTEPKKPILQEQNSFAGDSFLSSVLQRRVKVYKSSTHFTPITLGDTCAQQGTNKRQSPFGCGQKAKRSGKEKRNNHPLQRLWTICCGFRPPPKKLWFDSLYMPTSPVVSNGFIPWCD